MLYLSIGSAIVLIFIVCGWALLTADAAKLAQFLRWFIIISATALALFLVFRGQALLAAAPAAVAAIGWRLFRSVPLGLWFRGFCAFSHDPLFPAPTAPIFIVRSSFLRRSIAEIEGYRSAKKRAPYDK